MPNPPKHTRNKKATGKAAPAPVPAKRPSTPQPVAGAPDSTAIRITWAALHVLVFLVPLAISNLTFTGMFQLPLTYDQFDIAKVFVQRACGLVAIGAFSWHYLMQGGRIRRTKIDWLIIAFLGWVAVTTVASYWSLGPGGAATAFFGKYRRFEGFVSFVNYAVVFWLVVQYADRPSRIRSIVRTFVISSTFVALYGVAQYFGVDLITWGQLPFDANRAFATYGNPDLLGGFIIFPLAVTIGMALSEQDAWWRAFYWGSWIVTAAAWLTSFVRGAWIAGSVVLIIMVIAAVRSRVRLHKVDWGFAAVLAVFVAFFLFKSLNSSSEVLHIGKRVASIFDFRGGSGLTRLQIWQAAINAVKASPIFGFGADTFRLVFPKYKPYEYVAAAGYLSVADNVHDYPLQLMAGIGIPGFLLLYGTFAWTALQSASTALAKGKEGERLLMAGIWAAIVGYVVHLFFGLSVTGSTVFLWLSMALVLAPLAWSVDFKPGGWGGGVAVLVLAAVLLGLVGNVVYMVADNAYLKARVASSGMARVDQIERAIRLNPYNDMYKAELGLAWQDIAVNNVFTARSAQQAGQDPTEMLAQAQAAFDSAEKAFKDTIDFVPTEYDNYVFLTNLYNFGADYLDPKYREMAVETGKRGIEVEPFGPAVRYQLAVALAGKGDLEGAVAQLEQATKMDPAYGDAWALKADMLQRLGRLKEALAAWDGALVFQPTNQTYLDARAQLAALVSSATTPTK